MFKWMLYLKYFFEAETNELREEARRSALEYYSTRPKLRNATNFSAYKRGFINARCRAIAKAKLSQS
jgi:hypothetical protein